MRDLLRSHWFGADAPEGIEGIEEVVEVDPIVREKEKEEKEKLKRELEKLKREPSEKPLETPKVDELTTRSFWEEMKANANRARRGALMSGKSKQGGILGTMDVLGQAEVAGAKALGDAQEAMLSQLGQTERTAALLGKPTSLTEAERDITAGDVLLQRDLFKTYVGELGDEEAAIETFIRNGWTLPDFIQKTIPTKKITIKVKGVTKKDISFSDFYKLRVGKPDDKGNYPTFAKIKAEFNAIVAAGGVYDDGK